MKPSIKKRRRAVTLDDIARLAGLSRSSVSAVINGKKVRESTRRRVLECIRQTDYQAGVISRALLTELSEMVIVLVSGKNSVYSNMVATGINQVLKKGYYVLYHNVGLENEEDVESIKVLQEYRPAGYLLLRGAEGLNAQLAKIIARENIPFVIIGMLGTVDAFAVGVDESRAMESLTDFVLQKGHQRLAYLSGPPFSPASQARKMGFLASLVKNGLPMENVVFGQTQSDANSGYHAARALLTATRPRPTAILCFNDMTALGVYKAAAELNLQIPEDISVAGFDGLDLGEYVLPPLTTVSIRPERLGRQSAELLLSILRTGSPRGFTAQLVEPEIVARASVAPLG